MGVFMRLLAAIFLSLVLGLPFTAMAAGEPCGLELLNVPVGATIRVSAFWKSDDVDEAIEDEGYIFEVVDGGSGKMGIWRQPFLTYAMPPFLATGSRVAVIGYKDPDSTGHFEGMETEGCQVTATINSLPPWVKDYSRNAFPYLTIGSAGLMTLGNLHPAVKIAGLGVAFTAVVAKVLADDPIDCASAKVTKVPKKLTLNPPSVPEDDTIAILSNKIARNGTLTLGLARVAVINANRAACPTFSAKKKQKLFLAAQKLGTQIGANVALLPALLNDLARELERSGIILDEVRDRNYLLQDWHFNFVEFADPAVDGLFLQVLSADELDDYKDGAMGVALIDFHAQTRLYPDIWPDGLRWIFPAIEQWSASLIAKETGQ